MVLPHLYGSSSCEFIQHSGLIGAMYTYAMIIYIHTCTNVLNNINFITSQIETVVSDLIG